MKKAELGLRVVDLLETEKSALENIIRIQEGEIQKDSPNGILTGTLSSIDDSGIAEVQFEKDGVEHSALARSLVPLSSMDVGRTVALLFEGNDPLRPIVIGLFQRGLSRDPQNHGIELQADGERLTFTAEREIVLRCGAASITLTREGKVLVRGTYVLSRSSGVNKIKGGSVQIN